MGSRPEHTSYRPDIDGLRALAVLGVILYHAGAPFATGGYLGVDVFFVISGYLITKILAEEISRGGVDIGGFYRRRARRILPALVFVLALCVPPAFILLLPAFLQDFGQELFATLLFSNNFRLALTIDYWDLVSTYKPLLHTWSLGVEEQFYIAFPLLLTLAARFGRSGQILAISIAGVVSFGLAEATLRWNPNFNFYLPTSRAWELMMGSIAAYIPRKARRSDEAVTLLCVVSVIIPMASFGEVPTPSVWTLPSTIATLGLLVCNRPELTAARVLSWRPLVLVGLISYSAYLWHQPLFAFARVARFSSPSALEMTFLVLLTIVCAALTWRFVEQPFRNPAFPFRRLVIGVILPGVFLAGLGLVIHFNGGFPYRAFPNMGPREDVTSAYNERVRKLGAVPFRDNGRPNILIIGNSFARDAANVLLESGALDGKNMFYSREEGTCPVPSTARSKQALRDADILVVAISGDGARCIKGAASILEADLSIPVIYFGSKYFGENINPFVRTPMNERRMALADSGSVAADHNRQVAAHLPPERFIDLMKTLGTDGRHLRFFDDRGNPLTFDRAHFTKYGAVYVAKRLRRENSSALNEVATARRLKASGGLGEHKREFEMPAR